MPESFFGNPIDSHPNVTQQVPFIQQLTRQYPSLEHLSHSDQAQVAAAVSKVQQQPNFHSQDSEAQNFSTRATITSTLASMANETRFGVHPAHRQSQLDQAARPLVAEQLSRTLFSSGANSWLRTAQENSIDIQANIHNDAALQPRMDQITSIVTSLPVQLQNNMLGDFQHLREINSVAQTRINLDQTLNSIAQSITQYQRNQVAPSPALSTALQRLDEMRIFTPGLNSPTNNRDVPNF